MTVALWDLISSMPVESRTFERYTVRHASINKGFPSLWCGVAWFLRKGYSVDHTKDGHTFYRVLACVNQRIMEYKQGVKMDNFIFGVILLTLNIVITNSEKYIVLPVQYTFKEASNSCSNQGGTLPLANNDALMVRLADEMSSAGFIEMWVNAKETLYPWEWISGANKAIESDQGCFLGSALQGFTRKEYDRMKKDECIGICKAKGKDYAALMVSDRSNYGVCRCGDILKATGVSNVHWCDAECPGDQQPSDGIPSPGFCGQKEGTDEYFRVFHTNSTSELSWGEGPVKDDDLCGAVIFQELPEIYHYTKKENCSSKLNYICHLPNIGNLCNLINNDGTCFTISEGSDLRGQKTWFEARQACLTYGGDLASLNKDIAKRLSGEGFMKDAVEYWVGLTASHWRWNNMDSPAFLEAAWSPGQPMGIDKHCLLMDYNRTWTNEKCSVKHSYFCRIETHETTNPPLPIPTFAPISSTTPTTIKKPTTTPVEVTDDPQLQSQEKPGLSAAEIAGIVVGIILTLVAIAVVMVVGVKGCST
ncbi:hypothetical protein CAPTEDRAFT_220619 [Capitella teleta]|uniref:C-type lectin domain-containing protein n=1 Tax=Capitella teleta TaxID=283909 RepID=R7UB09_CAPTE|nr:hypothetical protein CAPTEDRAFT_220619 [Capitella teleta]|eukprot:ELU00427.1 hypothetical protein CAPTEDRAFT_220619 [Capitella teleta]